MSWENMLFSFFQCAYTPAHPSTWACTFWKAIYRFVVWNVVQSNNERLKPSIVLMYATERRKVGGSPQGFLSKFCTKPLQKIWFIAEQKLTLCEGQDYLSCIYLKENISNENKLLEKLLLTFQERLEEEREQDWNTRHERVFIVPHHST